MSKTEFPLFEKALLFAARRHSGQIRKGTKVPYIVHPVEVASIAATITSDDTVLAAAVLHDTLEDTNTKPRELRMRFGQDVLDLVMSESEIRIGESNSENWMERKEESIDELKRSTDVRIKILWLCDKLSNLRSLYFTYLDNGEDMWNVFHQKDPKMHEWYYRSVFENTTELQNTKAYVEYGKLLKLLFSGREP